MLFKWGTLVFLPRDFAMFTGRLVAARASFSVIVDATTARVQISLNDDPGEYFSNARVHLARANSPRGRISYANAPSVDVKFRVRGFLPASVGIFRTGQRLNLSRVASMRGGKRAHGRCIKT